MCWKSGNRHSYRFVIGELYCTWVGRKGSTPENVRARGMVIEVVCLFLLRVETNCLPIPNTLSRIASFDGTQDDCITFRKSQEYMTAIPLRTMRPLKQDGLTAWPHPT